MLTEEELYVIRNSQRWPVKFSDFFGQYFFVIFPAMGVFLGTIVLNSGIENGLPDLKLVGLAMGAIFILALLFVLKRLYENGRFKKYYMPGLTSRNIADILVSAGFKNLKHDSGDCFQCASTVSWFSWGEQVTLVYSDDSLLINSRPNHQPITIFKDKSNIRKIVAAARELIETNAIH